MRTLSLLLPLVLAAAWPGIATAGALASRHRPPERDVYLMEDDLVYARFLILTRDGSYRQIDRDARGTAEVDRGRWSQDPATGVLSLHGSCQALRPRALRSGPLSVVISRSGQIDALPRLVAAVQRLLAAYSDGVFDASALAEVNAADVPAVRIDGSSPTFDRADAAALAARASEILESARTGDYHLVPVPHSSPPLFTLPGGVFQAADVAEVRRSYRVAPTAAPPFYFARVDARRFAAEVGAWRPLHLPAGQP